LNFSYYISKRIRSRKVNSFSGTIHIIAVASIAIGLTAMIISFLILGGFKNKIREKIFSFGGHLQVKKFTFSGSFEEEPISTENELVAKQDQIDFIEHIQPFAHKPGLLKANEEIAGILLKGISPEFDFSRFKENMLSGGPIEFNDTTDSKEIIISSKIANKLILEQGDEILVYFIQDPPRVRKLTITGIYETGMEDFDDKIILGDIKLVQKLNGWPKTLVGGYEVFLEDFSKIDYARNYLDEYVLEPNLFIEKITEVFLEIFDWMKLLDKNVYILVVITLIVACINMTSILLILIMERIQMIGILKAMGSTNKQVRQIFIFNGMNLIVKGLIWGNTFGLGLAALQYFTKAIKLDPQNYYMTYVPINWNWEVIIGLNVLVFLIVSLFLIVPAIWISNIKPIRSIRFD